jgi:hypothetical protein
VPSPVVPPPQGLSEPTPTEPTAARAAPSNVMPPQQCLAEPTPTDIAEARAAPSLDVPATTVAGSAHADRANGGQSSALTCRVHHQSGWLSLRRPSEQRPEQRPHLTCLPPQWLTEPKLTERTEARAAPSPDAPATSVADSAHANRANRGQSSALTCRALLLSRWLGPRRPRELWPEQRPRLMCPPPQ